MRSFYLGIRVYLNEKLPFSGAYPLIYSDCWSFYMRIHYMRAYFWSPYLYTFIQKIKLVKIRYQLDLFLCFLLTVHDPSLKLLV